MSQAPHEKSKKGDQDREADDIQTFDKSFYRASCRTKGVKTLNFTPHDGYSFPLIEVIDDVQYKQGIWISSLRIKKVILNHV